MGCEEVLEEGGEGSALRTVVKGQESRRKVIKS